MADAKTKLSIEQKIAQTKQAYRDVTEGREEEGSKRWAEDAVFHSQLRGKQFQGRAAILAEFRRQRDEGSRLTVHDVCASDEHVVALLEGTDTRDGKQTTRRVIQIAHLNEQGQVTEAWSIFNPQEG